MPNLETQPDSERARRGTGILAVGPAGILPAARFGFRQVLPNVPRTGTTAIASAVAPLRIAAFRAAARRVIPVDPNPAEPEPRGVLEC